MGKHGSRKDVGTLMDRGGRTSVFPPSMHVQREDLRSHCKGLEE